MFLTFWRATINECFNLASGGVCMDQCCRQHCGELLPRLFILTRTTQGYSGYFLLHFPSSCLDLPLASTLLCEARTFLKLSITLNLRPSDQADDNIITYFRNLSTPFLKIFFEIFSGFEMKKQKISNFLS